MGGSGAVAGWVDLQERFRFGGALKVFSGVNSYPCVRLRRQHQLTYTVG